MAATTSNEFIENYKKAVEEKSSLEDKAQKIFKYLQQVQKFLEEQNNAPVWTRKSQQEIDQVKNFASLLVKELKENPSYSKEHLDSLNKTIEEGKSFVENYREATSNNTTAEEPAAAEQPAATPATEIDDENTVTYTYKPGDTFGQVVKDLGLGTDAGLWGPEGDVEFYTKQLEDQLWKSGVWPQGVRQNIPIGTTIKLRRRNAPAASATEGPLTIVQEGKYIPNAPVTQQQARLS